MDAAIRLGVAALIGLAVGIEREWSGHAKGPAAHFAGLRTFLILGLAGGIAGLLSASGDRVEGALVLLGGVALVVAAFVAAMRRTEVELDGTTEVAALAVLGLAVLAGGGQLALAAGAVAVIVLVLGEKTRLHGMVKLLGETELQAAARFAVMALVILPLLPATPLPWGGEISPRGLWMLVLLFSGINFGGYIARRLVGPERGYGVAGTLGGVVSSTLVTLQFARRSREEPEHANALALGTVAACTVLPARLLAITAVLSPSVALAGLRFMIPPVILGVGIVVWSFRKPTGGAGGFTVGRSPLQVFSSIKMAGAFLGALLAIDWLQGVWGTTGIYTSAILLGLTDMDALTVAMTRLGGTDGPDLAARGIAVGVISNTVFKTTVAVILGNPAFRLRVAVGLGVLGAAVGVGFLGW
jgi:uncharacterized membrane protein (DUF4010 family)